MYKTNQDPYRVIFDDTRNPATATWIDRPTTTTVSSFDPILFLDHLTNRTFVSDLLPNKTSQYSFSDDDGGTYMPGMGFGINSGVDHQTLGGGPFATGGAITQTPTTAYPDAVYYCSQDIATAECALSRDGGLTYTGNGAAVPIYNLTQCVGIHGHVKVAPDGTVYVPNKSCGANQGMAVSTDNGLNWTVRTVPDSILGEWDPSIGIGTNNVGRPGGSASNTIYFGYDGGNSGHALVAVSHDRGLNWSSSVDVGAAFGIQNTAFPAVVAGDDNRAAFAFLGSTTGGDGGTADPTKFNGIWHLYIAYTYDGGLTWVTTDATPNDPVQKGPICNQGTTCMGSMNTRNLLDFMDVTVDKLGRVLVGYADGCIDACDAGGDAGTSANSYSALATIARQTSGLRLFAQSDPAGSPTAAGTMTPVASGTVPASTTATVPASVTLTVPASVTVTLTVPASTTATVPASTTATVPASTTATIPASMTATVPASTTATTPASTSATVLASTTATVRASTTATVPASVTVTLTVPASTTATVRASTTATGAGTATMVAGTSTATASGTATTATATSGTTATGTSVPATSTTTPVGATSTNTAPSANTSTSTATSTATNTATSTATSAANPATSTNTPLPPADTATTTATSTPTTTATNTPTNTNTAAPATNTNTAVPPTNTSAPSAATTTNPTAATATPTTTTAPADTMTAAPGQPTTTLPRSGLPRYNPRIALSPGAVAPGTVVVVHGSGFASREQVTLALDGAALLTQPLTVVTDRAGRFTARFVAPDSLLSGPNSVSAIGAVSRLAALATLVGLRPSGTRLYLAGGELAPGTRPLLQVLNPGNRAAAVTIALYFADGTVQRFPSTVAAHSQRQVPLDSLTAHRGAFGLVLSATAPIAAQLTLRRAGRDGDGILARAGLDTTWYLAEGYTGGTFHESVSILNPDPARAARVTLRLLALGGRGSRTLTISVPAHSEQVVDVNRLLPGHSLSIVATSDRGIVVERSLTFSRLGRGRGATNGYGLTTRAGINVAASSWLFAEGSTANHFETFLTILNPGTTTAHVTARFYGRTGAPLGSRTMTVAGLSRANIKLNDLVDASGIASTVLADQPIVVERPEYFGSPNGARVAGSDVFGSNGGATRWSFAGGSVDGNNEFLLLFNPSARSIPVGITFYGADGRTVERSVTLQPNQRATLDVRRLAPEVGASHGVTLLSRNGQGFIAEQTVFSSNLSTLDSTQGQAR